MTDYNRTPEAQDVFKEKRKPKGPIKFKMSLNEEQKEAKDIILNTPVTLIEGKAGSGKTTLACQIALDLLFRREIEQIIIARPFVTAGENIGYLPGGVDQKLEYLTFPIYDLMNTMTGDPAKIEKIQSENKIKVMPVGFLRGHTFSDSMIIIDEAQNLTPHEIKTLLSRVATGSKIILSGDPYQIDVPYLDFSTNGLVVATDRFKGQPIFGGVFLPTSERSEISRLVQELL